MNCPRCGAQLTHAGQGHSCAGGPLPVVRPPARWQVAFWTALTLALVFVVLSLLRAAVTADVVTAPAGLPLTALSFAVPLALFVACLVWSNMTKGFVEGQGGAVALVRNWAMTCGLLLLFLTYLLPAKTPTAFHLARAGAAVLFVVGLSISRAKLGRWLADPAAPPGAAAAAPGAQFVPPAAHVPGSWSSPAPQQRSGPRIGTPVARLIPSPEPQPQDWDASVWDPEIQADIERRRRNGDAPA